MAKVGGFAKLNLGAEELKWRLPQLL